MPDLDDLPSHASPYFHPQPLSSSRHALSDYNLNDSNGLTTPSLPGILSPAFTPPSTPGTGSGTPALLREPKSIPVGPPTAAITKQARLLETLPRVDCIVRARIPTVTGAEMFLHLYQNDADNKEHLAIVFGNEIRSHSLDSIKPGESEMDRMIRGAYTGRLYPGRTSSRFDSHPLRNSISADESENMMEETSLERTSLEPSKAPLVRIHSECYTGETAWSARCDCGEQLDEAARLMSLPSSTGGVIIYLRQEGRGIGLGEKLKAYNLQDMGADTVEANLLLRHPADARSYGLATAMLEDLGLGGETGIRLLTNNPDKIRAVEGPNREIVVKERVPMIPIAWKTGGRRGIHSEEIEGYLRTKIGKMGHMIS